MMKKTYKLFVTQITPVVSNDLTKYVFECIPVNSGMMPTQIDPKFVDMINNIQTQKVPHEFLFVINTFELDPEPILEGEDN